MIRSSAVSQLLEILSRENEVLKMEQEIHARVRESIEANQRDYYLHEQMRVIQDELGENEKRATISTPIMIKWKHSGLQMRLRKS